MSGPRIDASEQLSALGQAVITIDVHGVVVDWNPAAEALYGWTAEEAVGSTLADLCVPELARELGAEIMAALRDGVAWTGTFPVRRKDGTVFASLVTNAGVYRGGELVGFVGVSTDLGSTLRPLLERSADAALVLRGDATITFASPAVGLLFGWHEDDLVGESILPLLHPDDRRLLAGVLADVVRQPGARPVHEVRVRRGERWAWAEAALTNFLDDPVVRGVVCNLRRSLAQFEEESATQRVADLESALHSRLVVEQASGYVAGRDGIDVVAAFDRLREHARVHHMSVSDVAERVMAGELPLPPSEAV